jgi:hypothetical protein
MHVVGIDVSHKQLSKLRNGHPVRIRKGKGFNLLVHPERYDIITQTFGRGKALQVALSPEEINANKEYAMSPEAHAAIRQDGDSDTIEGLGIFHRIRDFAKKAISVAKPFIQKHVHEAIHKGAEALGDKFGIHPAVVSGAAELVKHGANHLLDKATGGSVSNIGGPRNRLIRGDQLMDNLNHHLGTNYGYLQKAGVANVMAHAQRAKDTGMMINSRHNMEGLTGLPVGKGLGAGLGAGLYASGLRRGRGLVGTGGSFVAHQTSLPPALQSDPFGANFHFQFQLPPQFQKLHQM